MAGSLALYTASPDPNAGIPRSDGAPYDPNSLSPPLTGTQKVAITAYLVKEINAHHITGVPSLGTLNDAQLIALYRDIVAMATVGNAPITGPPNPIKSIEDFLNLLANSETWVRVGEFVAGLLLVGIGIHAIAKGNPGYEKKVVSPIRKAARGAGIITETRHARSMNQARREAGTIRARATRTNAEAREVRAINNLSKANKG